MCLSTVYNVSDGKRDELMRDVAQIEVKNGGLFLINMFGEKKFVPGKIMSVDFVDEHSVLLEENPGQMKIDQDS
ncbi:CooT family nickel-binding protein [Thermodesulfobacteriota bacterium]